MRYIYVLIDPTNNDIRYVGQTNNIKRRLKDHLNSSKNNNTHKCNWIKKLLENGNIPILKVIEECKSLYESNTREKYFIQKLTNEGYKLTNSYSTDVTDFSLETRVKMSNAKFGKKLEEIVGEEKAVQLKKYYSERMSISNPSKSSDIIVKSKISNTLKEYFKDKSNHWAYGMEMSDEHNEKLRLSKIGNVNNVGNRIPKTEDQKEKIRKKITGSKIKRSKILQFNINGFFIREWDSMRQISREDITLNRTKISQCCNGIKKSYAGFLWKYKD